MARKGTVRPRHRRWWGDGDAPHEQWSGVSIEIPVAWSSARGRWESHSGRYYYDMATGDLAEEFFPKYLRHFIGRYAGQPFALLDYQIKLLTRPIFGWKRTGDGLRRFRKVFFFGPKACGKSPWLSGTGLYLLLCDREAAAEVYTLASDRQQARIVHDGARVMVEESPELSAKVEILRDSIYCPATRSTYQVLSSDAASAHGRRPHAVLFDELHAQPNRDLFEALKKSLAKRMQPLLLLASHAGDDDEGICYEEYEGAKRVLSGTAENEETFLPVIFEASPTDDWTEPATWHRTNPGLGVTAQEQAIAIDCEEARSEPRKVNDFLRFHLNRWVNQAVAWIPVDWWDACAAPMPSDDELRQYPCAVGIDMAQKIDLAAGVVAFRLPLADDGNVPAVEVTTEDPTGAIVKRTLSLDFRVALLPAFWLPEDTLRERVRQDRVPYDLWSREILNGEPLLNVVDGAIIGADPIVSYFAGRDGKSAMVARFPRLKAAQFAYDPAFATEVALALRDRFGLTTVEVLQNYTHLSEACQVFEALVKAKRIIHGGHRLLRWNLENVAIKRDDAGRIRPVKPKRATKRIDGVVAAIMAISRLMLLPPERPRRHVGARIWTPSGWRPA